MVRYSWIAAILAALAFIVPQPASAQEAEAMIRRDIAGGSDHPLVGRYTGSFMLARTQKAFDELKLPSGKAEGATYSNDKKFSSVVTVQGTATRMIYIAPTGRSSLEVLTNFTDSVTGKGFQPVFTCAGADCGESFVVLKYRWDNPSAKVLGPNYEQIRRLLVDAAFDQMIDVRYGLFKKSAPEGDTYVAIYGGVHRGGGFGTYSTVLSDRVGVLVEIVEPRAMEKRMAMVTAEEIGTDLGKQGKAIFYGIRFDFDKADIKAESEPQLAEMAKFLKANAALKAFVIGHTDNKGALDYNVNLSNRRADAASTAWHQHHDAPPAL